MTERKPHDIAFVRVRLMSKNERGEWVCAQVDPQGIDLEGGAAFVWAEERSIVTLEEARKIARGR
jgi:hypothetical protein